MKMLHVLGYFLVSGVLVIATALAGENHPDLKMVYDFNPENGLGGWEIEDDVIMGGVSRGRIAMNEEGVAVFSGEVSLDNDGGFSSIQYFFDTMNIDGYRTACLRIKGDGKSYQFIVEARRGDPHYYSYRFKSGNEWETVRIPLHAMEPYRRGDKMDLPDFPAKELSQVRLLIGNAKAESFRLEIDAIWLE